MNFHAGFYGIVEPLLHKVPPTLLLPAPEVIPPPQPEQMTLDTYEKTLEVASSSGVKKSLVFEENILKTLEALKAENSAVRERMDRQDEMVKSQVETNTKVEGMLGTILSRLPPPSYTLVFFKPFCFLSFSLYLFCTS